MSLPKFLWQIVNNLVLQLQAHEQLLEIISNNALKLASYSVDFG